MKIYVYVNKAKDPDKSYTNKIFSILESEGIEYELVDGSEGEKKGDALIVFGGDGTILKLNKFASMNKLPIIGINAGTIGFLPEFETSELEYAIKCFKNGTLIPDVRTNLLIETEGKSFVALNEASVQRIFSVKDDGVVANLSIYIDDYKVEDIFGDGVIVATPTGSTAYSLSAGGAVLAPGINAFEITAIAPHSFSNRPVVFSARFVCKIINNGKNNTALFIDGKFSGNVKNGQVITLRKAECETVFLRKEKSGFYDKLVKKLNRGNNGLWQRNNVYPKY